MSTVQIAHTDGRHFDSEVTSSMQENLENCDDGAWLEELRLQLKQLRKATKEPPKDRLISLNLPRQVTDKLYSFVEHILHEPTAGDLPMALRRLARDWSISSAPWARQLCPVALVLADLVDQGWVPALSEDRLEIQLRPPGLRGAHESAEEAKARLKRQHQVGRLRQLEDGAVNRFLRRMEEGGRGAGARGSVLDLIDDGRDLAEQLQCVMALSSDKAAARLREIIDPVVEVCDEGARCGVTGLPLAEIWRYVRHTWSLEYRSIPGRTMPLLVRNAARPRRPVIGIAMLASPVIRTTTRDNWIGWSLAGFLQRVTEGEWNAKEALHALDVRVEQSLGEVRWDDLATAEEIAEPTERAILRLEQDSAGAAAARMSLLREEYENEHTKSRRRNLEDEDQDWKAASEDLLFKRKRAETLAQLLAAKRVLRRVDWRASGPEIVCRLMRDADSRQALSAALLEVRKAGLASQVADLSVCGAVAPYGPLLGGKLVALLMASAEVGAAYRARYDGKVSLISSAVAGRPIQRPADLKVLTTTSLYGTASSQYNRIRLSASRYPNLGRDVHWEEREAMTAGYGTIHLSTDTVCALRELGRSEHRARRINSDFGEGASPRLRQVREGLDVLGVASDHVLHHTMSRRFYGCRLTPTAHEELFGLAASTSAPAPSVAALAEAWRRRWLVSRSGQTDVLKQVERLGPASVRAELLPASVDGQFLLPLA
jgi:DNA-binding transcriptional ArsR family regulator